MHSYDLWLRCGESPVAFAALLVWVSILVGTFYGAGWELGKDAIRGIGRLISRLIALLKKP